MYGYKTWKYARKRLLGRPRSRWEDNVRKDPKQMAANANSWVVWLNIGIIGELL
jgi:hypothetical protein